jgi:hypothetical protein
MKHKFIVLASFLLVFTFLATALLNEVAVEALSIDVAIVEIDEWAKEFGNMTMDEWFISNGIEVVVESPTVDASVRSGVWHNLSMTVTLFDGQKPSQTFGFHDSINGILHSGTLSLSSSTLIFSSAGLERWALVYAGMVSPIVRHTDFEMLAMSEYLFASYLEREASFHEIVGRSGIWHNTEITALLPRGVRPSQTYSFIGSINGTWYSGTLTQTRAIMADRRPADDPNVDMWAVLYSGNVYPITRVGLVHLGLESD